MMQKQKICPQTILKIGERRTIKNDASVDCQRISKINKEISKTIKKDIRKYKNKDIIQTTEENTSMKVLRRKSVNKRKEICTLMDKTGEVTSNREEILHIIEEFYDVLYRNKSTSEFTLEKVIYQGYKDIPDISKNGSIMP